MEEKMKIINRILNAFLLVSFWVAMFVLSLGIWALIGWNVWHLIKRLFH
jgi:uncharacterized membrane protein